MGALCGPLWERCCCRGEKRPGDLQQMAPDRGDGGWSASAGIAAEPQVSRRRAPRSQDGCAFTATSTTLRSRAPSPAQGQPLHPGRAPCSVEFSPSCRQLLYCSLSYLLFRCVLEALRPMQHFSSQRWGDPGSWGGHRLEGVPALQGSPNNLEENKQTYFCMCECVCVCRCVTNIKFPSQSKGQAPCPHLWYAQAPGRGRLPSGMELPCSIPILSLLPKSELIPVAGGAGGRDRGQR